MHTITLNFKILWATFIYALIGFTSLITSAHASQDLIGDDKWSHAAPLEAIPPSIMESDEQRDHNTEVKAFTTFISTIDLDIFDQEVQRDIEIGRMGIGELEDAGEFFFAAAMQLALENKYTASIDSKFQGLLSVLLNHYYKLSLQQNNVISAE